MRLVDSPDFGGPHSSVVPAAEQALAADPTGRPFETARGPVVPINTASGSASGDPIRFGQHGSMQEGPPTSAEQPCQPQGYHGPSCPAVPKVPTTWGSGERYPGEPHEMVGDLRTPTVSGGGGRRSWRTTSKPGDVGSLILAGRGSEGGLVRAWEAGEGKRTAGEDAEGEGEGGRVGGGVGVADAGRLGESRASADSSASATPGAHASSSSAADSPGHHAASASSEPDQARVLMTHDRLGLTTRS